MTICLVTALNGLCWNELICAKCDPEVFKHGDCANPADTFDLLSDMYKGLVKCALLASFKASSEEHLIIHRKPDQTVTVSKNFAVGSLKVVAVSNNVMVSRQDTITQVAANVACLGRLFNHKGVEVHGFVKQCLQWPAKSGPTGCAGGPKASGAVLAAYWAVRPSPDKDECNVEKTEREITVKVASETCCIKVPFMVNTKALKSGDELVVYQQQTLRRLSPRQPRIRREAARARTVWAMPSRKRRLA
jgi:hypothetical protein